MLDIHDAATLKSDQRTWLSWVRIICQISMGEWRQ